MLRKLAMVGVALWMGLSPANAGGTVCGPQNVIMPLLMEKMQLAPTGVGRLADNSGMVAHFRNAAGKWAITVTAQDGMTCVLLIGYEWKDAHK